MISEVELRMAFKISTNLRQFELSKYEQIAN